MLHLGVENSRNPRFGIAEPHFEACAFWYTRAQQWRVYGAITSCEAFVFACYTVPLVCAMPLPLHSLVQ